MADPTLIEAEVRAFLVAHAAADLDEIQAIDVDGNVWDLFESLDLLELVEFLERRFALKIAPIEVLPANFASIAKIIAFVTARAAK